MQSNPHLSKRDIAGRRKHCTPSNPY